MADNYYGTMPERTGYGYSGQGAKKGSNMNVVMAGAAGLGVGAAMGIGGYMAYRSMRSGSSSLTGTAYDQSWCQRPDGTGSVMTCKSCFDVYGSRCQSENNCYSAVGCAFKVDKNMERDDIMTVGFIPQDFTPPLTVTITQLVGGDFPASKCPVDPSGGSTPTFDDTWAKAESVDVDLFMTLTQVENIPGGAKRAGEADAAISSSLQLPLLGFLILVRLMHGRFF